VDVEQKKRLFNELKRQFQKEYKELLEQIDRFKKEYATGDKLPKKFYLEIADIVLVCAALTMYRVYLEKEMKRLNLAGNDPHFVRLDTDYVHAKELRAILHDALNGRFALVFKKSN
jgi:hypothetical protein